MAFSDTTVRLTVEGEHTAIGNSDSTLSYAGDAFISGTFVGTAVLQAQDTDGTWHNVCAFTEPGVQVYQFARARPVRIRCSAFTSGQIDYRIEIVNEFINAR